MRIRAPRGWPRRAALAGGRREGGGADAGLVLLPQMSYRAETDEPTPTAPKEAGFIERVGSAGVTSVVAGGIVGAVKSSWEEHSVKHGQMGSALRHSARVIAANALLFGAVGTTFAAAESVLESTRGTDDALNSVGAGCLAGAVLGLRSGSPGLAAGGCAALAAAVGAVEAAQRTKTKPTNSDALLQSSK